MSVPGPAALGRGVIVADGSPAPVAWGDAVRVVVDDDVLRAPAAAVAQLHGLWAARTAVVVDLRVPVEMLRASETDERAPHALTPAFEFARERLYFLVRANNYDARDGTPRWWPAMEAERLGAQPGHHDRRDAGRRHGRVVRRRAPHRRTRSAGGAPVCVGGAGAARRCRARHERCGRGPRTRPAGRGAPRGRPGPDPGPCRIGQDHGAHRPLPPPRRRTRLRRGLQSSRSRTTSARATR